MATWLGPGWARRVGLGSARRLKCVRRHRGDAGGPDYHLRGPLEQGHGVAPFDVRDRLLGPRRHLDFYYVAGLYGSRRDRDTGERRDLYDPGNPNRQRQLRRSRFGEPALHGDAGSQTITFAALANQALGTAPFAVSATASSGLAVTFTSITQPSVRSPEQYRERW